MSRTTILASGQITTTDALRVELQKPDDLPVSILITWPRAPSVVDPRRFGATANAVTTAGAEQGLIRLAVGTPGRWSSGARKVRPVVSTGRTPAYEPGKPALVIGRPVK